MNTPRHEVALIAQKMAKAAGNVSPEVLTRAAMMVIEVACMVKSPDKWIEMKNKDGDAK